MKPKSIPCSCIPMLLSLPLFRVSSLSIFSLLPLVSENEEVYFAHWISISTNVENPGEGGTPILTGVGMFIVPFRS